MVAKKRPEKLIIANIFEFLKKTRNSTIKDLVQATGSSHETIKSKLEMIQLIQSEEKVQIDKVGRIHLINLQKEGEK